MKLQILSDLHKEFDYAYVHAGKPILPDQWELPETDADVVILAGDTDTGTKGVEWAAGINKPVIYVLGNHEYYGHDFATLVEKCKDAARGTNVHVLENDSVIIDGVRFLGCTLWTDFDLYKQQPISMIVAARGMNDYSRIRNAAKGYRKLWPEDVLETHLRSRAWLTEQLAKETHNRTVVVTHHTPSGLCDGIKGEFGPAYSSNLEEMVASSGAVLWVHGHTHWCTDFKIGDTRVLSNQRGYENMQGVSAGFNKTLIVEV